MWVRILSEQLQINSDFPCNDINMVHNYLWIKVFLVGSHRGKRWTKNLITCLYANCFKLEYLQTVGVIKNWMIYAANICFEVYISGFCLFSLFVFNILDKIERFFLFASFDWRALQGGKIYWINLNYECYCSIEFECFAPYTLDGANNRLRLYEKLR